MSRLGSPVLTLAPVPSGLTQQQQTVGVTLVAVKNSRYDTARAPRSKLGPPRVVAPPAPSILQQQTVVVKLPPRARIDLGRRGTHARLPAVVFQPLAFFASPVRITLARIRPRKADSFLTKPTTLQTFTGPQVHLVRTRPPRTHAEVTPPAVVRVPSVEQREQTIQVTLAGGLRANLARRASRVELRAPAVLQTFAGPQVELVALRARSERIRRQPDSRLPQIVYPVVAGVFYGPFVHFAVPIARRRTAGKVGAPQVVFARTDVYYGPLVHLAPSRRPKARSELSPPAVVTTATPAFYGPQVHVVRARPLKVRNVLGEPTVLQVFPGPQVHLARPTRPRTRSELQPPFFYPQTSTVQIHPVRIRPRKATSFLAKPTALQTFVGPQVHIIPARRPKVRSELQPPAVVAVVSVAFYGPQAELVAARARVDRIRRQPDSRLFRPAVVEPSLRQPDRRLTVNTTLARIRPPHVRGELTPPTVLQTFVGPQTHLAPARRPRTYSKLAGLVVAASVSARRIITVSVAPYVRPRRVLSELHPPTAVAPASALLSQETITVKLARIRPARTHARLSPPVFLPATSTIDVTRVRTRPAPIHSRLAPPTVLAVFGGPRVELVHTLPRRTIYDLRPPTVVAPVSALLSQQTIRVKLVRTRPPAIHSRLYAPLFLPAKSNIAVTVVRTRPRPINSVLGAPQALRTFSGPAKAAPVTRTFDPRRDVRSVLRPPAVVAAVFIAPEVTVKQAPVARRPVHSRLAPPATLAVAFIAAEVSVRLAPARRPATHSRLTAIFYPATSTIRTVLAASRTRATFVSRLPHSELRPPQVLLYFAGPAVYLTRLARIRLRALSELRLPSGRPFEAPPAINVTLAPARRPHTLSRLRPPTAVTPPPPPKPRPTAVYCVAVKARVDRLRRAPHFHLNPPATKGRKPGVACLVDVPATVGCLTDETATQACLMDTAATKACLTDEAAAQACLMNTCATTAILEDEGG